MSLAPFMSSFFNSKKTLQILIFILTIIILKTENHQRFLIQRGGTCICFLNEKKLFSHEREKIYIPLWQ